MRRLTTLLRLLVPLLALGWIAHRLGSAVDDPDQLRRMFRSENLPRLALAVIPYLAAIVLTFWRWFILVRALALPFRFLDALRLGFVGFFLQFLSLGAVGGDLFKAVFLAREQPQRRPEAIATVFIDRAVGMFGLLLVTCLAFVWLGWDRLPPQLHPVAISCFVVTAMACFVVVGLLWTQATTRPLRSLLRRFPTVCGVLLRAEHAVRLYRQHRISFVIAVGSAMISHCLLATSAFFAAAGVSDHPPNFGEQLVIWNIAGAVGTLPLSPGGLGTFEAAYTELYQAIPAGGGDIESGVAVAIVLRVVSLIVAAIGVIVYGFSRREMQALMEDNRQADAAAEAEDQPAMALAPSGD